jgi:hypothetical protein
LYNESGSAKRIRFQGNLEIGDIRFGSTKGNPNPFQEDLLGSLAESFVGTVNGNPSITGLGFKSFDPTLAGLPAGSRLLENAKLARRGSAGASSDR